MEDIQRLAKQAINDDDKMISSIAVRLGKAEKDGVKQAEHDLKKSQKGLRNLTGFDLICTFNRFGDYTTTENYPFIKNTLNERKSHFVMGYIIIDHPGESVYMKRFLIIVLSLITAI